MKNGRIVWLQGMMLLALALLMAACGGNGGAKVNGVVDPSASYTGIKTQATVTSGNAASMAVDGFGGNGIAGAVGNISVTAKAAADSQSGLNLPLQQFAQTIKQAARRMDLPGKAAPQQTKTGKGVAKTLQRAVSHQTAGDGGGLIDYSLEINDATGSFYGAIDFRDYTSQGVTVTGRAEMLGTFDATRQQLSRFTLTFRSLTMKGSNYSFTLIGTLSWGFNFTAAIESLSMNMVLVNNANSLTFWFNNYEVTTTYGSTSQTQSLSGRFYDPRYGYVELATPTPLTIYNGYEWPSEGTLLFTGQQGTFIRVNFSARSLLIEADTDGNGVTDWQEQRQTNTVPAINTPPVANAGADQVVSQWATVHLDGTASSDANGDPLAYSWSIVSYPQNGYPMLSGATTATPSFFAEQTGTYQFRLSVYDGKTYSPADTVSITVTSTTASSPNLLQEQWQYGLYGTSIGRAGLFTADLDGDGVREIVASASNGGFASNSYWYVMRRTASGTYEQIWRSKLYGTILVQLVLADVTGDGKDDIVAGLADGTVNVYDGPTLQLVRTVKTTSTLTALAVADLDGNGTKEIIASDGIGIFVYAADGSGLLWSIATGGGSSIAVGNVDYDPALEIVSTATGGKGYVIDGVSHAIEWEYVNGFGAQVRVADLDRDGIKEIIGAASWAKITVFEADRKSPAWEVATSQDIGSLAVEDVDKDGMFEILYGDGQWGKIHLVDSISHVDQWAVTNPDCGASGVAIGDVDQDGQPELLWGAGGSSTGADHLYIATPATGTTEWKSLHVDGPLTAVAVGDVDDDGEDEIVMVSYESDSGYAEGIIHIFNAKTHALEFQEKLGLMDWMGVRSVKIGDVDNDGKTEFVVTTGNIYDGVIRVYNGATHTLKKQSAGYNGNYFSSVAIGDVDGDGKTEIVAGQGREHTGASGSYLIVFDGATLQEKWRSVDLGIGWGQVYDIKLADLDGDGHMEISASLTGSDRLTVFDGVNHNQKMLIANPARALAVADVDGDGVVELLAGRTDGQIDIFNGTTYALKKSVFTFGKTAIDALGLADLDGDGTQEWLLTSGGFLTVLEGQGQGLKWRSQDLNSSLGLYNHLGIKDTDGDGRLEIVVGANALLYQFK